MSTATMTRCEIAARDIMTVNPTSISDRATLQQAITHLIQRQIGAAPVINDAGRPVGVLSRTDLLRFSFSNGVSGAPEMLGDFIDRATASCEPKHPIEVREVMTPKVLSVGLDASLTEVARKILDHNVHRLFVIDQQGTLVGAINALDVVRALTPL